MIDRAYTVLKRDCVIYTHTTRPPHTPINPPPTQKHTRPYTLLPHKHTRSYTLLPHTHKTHAQTSIHSPPTHKHNTLHTHSSHTRTNAHTLSSHTHTHPIFLRRSPEPTNLTPGRSNPTNSSWERTVQLTCTEDLKLPRVPG